VKLSPAIFRRGGAAGDDGEAGWASAVLAGWTPPALKIIPGDDPFAGAAEELVRAAMTLTAATKSMRRTERAVLMGKRIVGFASRVFWETLFARRVGVGVRRDFMGLFSFIECMLLVETPTTECMFLVETPTTGRVGFSICAGKFLR
jgi:hypothetical protein